VVVHATETKELESLESEIVARLRELPSRDTQSIRNLRQDFSKRLAPATPTLVVALALRLVGSPFVPRFFAYELVLHHASALRSLKVTSLQQLGSGMDGWGEVDAFACYLAGPAWRENQISDAVIKRWAKSPDRWWRRAALVSTVPLNSKAQAGKGDPVRTLQICSLLVADRDDMVVKALSWALRELSKRDGKSVRKFLHKNRNQLAARVSREVNNKLDTGLKNPRT
jgi:3-methyladenine DNA glycosylase AlkD